MSPYASCDLPPGIGRATLKRRYTWSYNPQAGRLPGSPRTPVSSYLTFSPLSRYAYGYRDGYFLFRYYALADIFPLGSAVLCVVRTFLRPQGRRQDGLLPQQDNKNRAKPDLQGQILS